MTTFDDNRIESDHFPNESNGNLIKLIGTRIESIQILINSIQISIESIGRAIGFDADFIARAQKLTPFA